MHDLKVEPSGRVLITGEVWSLDWVFVSANGQHDSLAKGGEYDHGIYLARFSAASELLQMEYFGTVKNDNANSIGLASDGSIVLAGDHMQNNDGDLEWNWLLMALNHGF